MRIVSPKQVAQAIGASEASLKRWCDKGLLSHTRTAGGHRRVPLSAVVDFIRKSGFPLVHPEVLGLPTSAGRASSSSEEATACVVDWLQAGDAAALRRGTFDLFLGGESAAAICDRVIAPAFRSLGAQCERGAAEVYQERRAVEMCRSVFTELRLLMPPSRAEAPLAIGGTVEADPHQLPSATVELALAESGWRTQLLGCDLPMATLIRALEREGPRLFWLCVSWLADSGRFVEGYARLFEAATARGVSIVVGGQALTPELRRQMRYAAFCDSLEHLTAFARTLWLAPRHEATPAN